MANDWVGKPIEDINARITEVANELQKENLSDEARQQLTEELTQLADASDPEFKGKCTSNNVDIGWMRENVENCRTYLNAEQYAYFVEITTKTDITGADPCGSGTLAQISKALQKFFTFLKGIKKYYDVYVQGTINAIQGLTSKIASITDLIAGVLRILVQRVRNYIITKIKNGLNDLFTQILPTLAGDIKDSLIKIIADTLFCKFREIIQGLVQLVQDFLFALIGNLINAPFCAAEEFANALINNLASRIDTALKPILDQINGILGGISQVAGSVFEAIDFILGFESFLCSNGPECPEIKNFKASWWAGPSKSDVDNFQKFTDKLGLKGYDASSLINKFDEWTGGFSIFGEKLGDFDSSTADPNGLLQCNTGAFACGPPQVEIFGGGGAGAVGKAIVNQIGQVVGVDLLKSGYGYTSPPFVTLIDNCGNGSHAAGYVELGDEDDGGTGGGTGGPIGSDVPIDPVTGAPIGQYSNTLPNSDIRNLDEEGCVYDATVVHEFDNTNNIHVNYEVSSAIDVEFKGKDYADGQPAIPGTIEKKHYSIKFKVPYEDDQYKINFYDLSNISAAIEQYDYRPDQLMKLADIQNKTRFGFDVWFGREKSRDINPNVFDTDTYINRNVKEYDPKYPGVIIGPEQKLYRMTSRITLTNDFIRQYAVAPYNPLDLRSAVDSYAGIWTARWEQIEFPLDAEYLVTIGADDNATVYIGNREGNGLKEIGNGLIDIESGGDETILRKSLAQSGKADTPQTYRIKMKKGLYRIRAEVEQSGAFTQVPVSENRTPGTLIVKENNNYFLLVGGNDLVQASFTFDWDDNTRTAGIAASKVIIDTENGPLILNRPSGSEKGSTSAKGKFKADKRYRIKFEGRASGSKNPQIVNSGPKPNQKDQRINLFDADGNDVNSRLTVTNAINLSDSRISSSVSQGTPFTPSNPSYIAMKIELAPEYYDENTVNQNQREFYNSYIRRFSFKTIGKRASCQVGKPLKRVVITNSGNGYLPVPNGEDEFGNQISNPGEGDSSRDYVGCLTEIQVLNTGIGYTQNDSVSITPDIPGLQVKVQLTEQGQIARMLVENPACGVTQVPEIRINSLTGTGGEFRPILEFTPVEEFGRTVPTEIIQVIDCV